MTRQPHQTAPHPWWALAAANVGRGTAAAIAFGSQEYYSWQHYFLELRWAPATLRLLGPGKSWTAPCRWPYELHGEMPPDYPRSDDRALRAWARAQHPIEVPLLQRMALSKTLLTLAGEMRARGEAAFVGGRKPFVTPDDARLRAIYPPKAASRLSQA